MWKGWVFDEKGLDTDYSELKWVNSTNTNDYMPETRTSFPNLFLAGAHVKTSVDLYSMESACATGRDAAFAVMGDGKEAFKVNKPKWMETFSNIDNGLYNNGMPSVVDTFLVIFVALIVILFIVLIGKRRNRK